MNNGNVHHKYTAIIVITVVLAGFFAAVLVGNVYHMLKSDPLPISKGDAAPRPQASSGISEGIAAVVTESSPALKDLYENFAYAPLWIDTRGATKYAASNLRGLRETAESANRQGITTTALTGLLAEATHPTKPADIIRIDVALTREALDLATALRLGAVPFDGKTGQDWFIPAEQFDPTFGLTAAIKDSAVAAFFAALPPRDAQYQSLVTGLQTYREIASRGGWANVPDGDEIRLDTNDPRVAILRARLAAEGYKKAENTEQLSEAVRLFQSRNGLEPDGRLGRGTLAALNVTTETRVSQILANLERYRHTTRAPGDRYIAVNTAATTLEYVADGKTQIRMKVVSGDKRHATPILAVKATGVTLNPRWEIPPSIAGKEILPKLKANPRYLADNNMVIVDGVDDPTGEFVDWSRYSAKTFPVRLRQRAGDDNALGVLKFQMNNPQNIYLHDTPSRKAFARFERHLSHGCIRVSQPVTLAQYALADSAWDESALNAEIGRGVTRTVGLKSPLPIYIYYWTAFTEDGVLNFRNDIYNRDAVLAAALTEDLKTPLKPANDKAVAALN